VFAVRFTKLHGLGNDYIYIDAISQDLAPFDLPTLSQVLSDRHFGIGGDGIILVLPSTVGDFRMRILNSDGSEAEMCGNGVRAFAKYVFEHGLTDMTSLEVETAAGIIKPAMRVEGGVVTSVRVDMGVPRLARAEIPMLGEPAGEPVLEEALEVGGRTLLVTCVSMGNPHCVTFVDDVEHFPVEEVGPLVENHRAFPKRTNAEFVTVIDRHRLMMRVWERGSGETLACGTGASAVCVAAVLTGRAERQVTVSLLGGELGLEWADDDHIFLTGPAAEAFSGEVGEALLASARL
jgi:diaminopimelate epimerase